MGKDMRTRSMVGAEKAFCREEDRLGAEGWGVQGSSVVLGPRSVMGFLAWQGCFRIHGKACFRWKLNQKG